MSFDLVIWEAPVPRSIDEVEALLDGYYEREAEDAFAPSRALVAFRRELLERYPALEDLPEESFDAPGVSPWSVTPVASDRVIELNVVWGTPDEVITTIAALVQRHGLILYDPQGPQVHLPDGRMLD